MPDEKPAFEPKRFLGLCAVDFTARLSYNMARTPVSLEGSLRGQSFCFRVHRPAPPQALLGTGIPEPAPRRSSRSIRRRPL